MTKKKKKLKYCPWSNHKIHCGDEPLVVYRLVWICKVPPLSIYRTSKFESMCSLEHFLAPFVQASLIGLSFSLISSLISRPRVSPQHIIFKVKPKYTSSQCPRTVPAMLSWWQRRFFLRITLSWRFEQICFREIHFTLQTSSNTQMESTTMFQTSHCISIMLSNYQSTQDHFNLSKCMCISRILSLNFTFLWTRGPNHPYSVQLWRNMWPYLGSERERERERDLTCRLGYASLLIFSFHWRGFCFMLSVAPYKSYHKFEIWSLVLLAFEPNVKMLLLLYLWSRQSIFNVLEIVILVDSDLFMQSNLGLEAQINQILLTFSSPLSHSWSGSYEN